MIKVGLIGMGIGQKHLEAIDGYRNCKVVSILEKNQNKILKLKKKYKKIKFFSNENLFFEEKLDIISIASYDQYHYQQIIKSIEKNCHVMVEKPVCLNIRELEKIKQKLKQKPKIRFSSNLVLRKNTLFNEIKKKVKIKDVYNIEASYLWGRKHKLFEWRSKTKEYSLTLGATIHLLDLICWMLNSKPVSVFTKTNKKLTSNTKFKKFSFANYFFSFPNNISVNLKADAVCVHPHYHTIKIFEKKKTTISDLNRQFEIKKKVGFNNFKIKNTNYAYPDKKNRGKFIKDFIDSIIDNEITQPSKKEIFNLMTACFYADLSAKYGKELKIKY